LLLSDSRKITHRIEVFKKKKKDLDKMGVLSESWCFCKGVGKSEKLKAALFTGKGPAIARISATANGISGTGFLIHRNLLLTAHVNIPSIAAAEGCEIRLQNGVAATLVPHRPVPFLFK
jgi:hypothetical protein